MVGNLVFVFYFYVAFYNQQQTIEILFVFHNISTRVSSGLFYFIFFYFYYYLGVFSLFAKKKKLNKDLLLSGFKLKTKRNTLLQKTAGKI